MAQHFLFLFLFRFIIGCLVLPFAAFSSSSCASCHGPSFTLAVSVRRYYAATPPASTAPTTPTTAATTATAVELTGTCSMVPVGTSLKSPAGPIHFMFSCRNRLFDCSIVRLSIVYLPKDNPLAVLAILRTDVLHRRSFDYSVQGRKLGRWSSNYR